MAEPLTLHLNDKPVQFTPDGKVSIIDAIGAVANSDRPRAIWEGLQGRHPEVLAFCDHYPFSEKETVPVADSEGWERIMPLLVTYLSDRR
jgi:hypothetical protein